MSDFRECPDCRGEVLDRNDTQCAECLARDAPYRPFQLSEEAPERFRPAAPKHEGRAKLTNGTPLYTICRLEL